MRHTTHDVLGQAAYIRRSCEIAHEQLRDIDQLVTGTEQLTPIQEAAVADANQRWAEGAKDHVELASQFIRDWHAALVAALRTEPSHLR